MLKTITITLCAAVILFVLAACGANEITDDTQNEPITNYADRYIDAHEIVEHPEDENDYFLEVQFLSYSDVNTGDIIELGDLLWRVLDVRQDRVLVLSEYIVANKAFHEPGGLVTWEDSTMRQYLNTEFMNRFTLEERAQIINSRVVNDGNLFEMRRFEPHSYGFKPSTYDYIFLLSHSELMWYVADSALWGQGRWRWVPAGYQPDSGRVANMLDGGAGTWWLRCPSVWHYYRPAVVTGNGSVAMGGMPSDTSGAVGYRPALWLKLEGFTDERADFDPWSRDNFASLRAPARLSDETPHGAIAVGHIEFLNDGFYRRMAFTYREKDTAVWIVEELLAMGHSWENIEIQEFYMYDPLVVLGMRTHTVTRLKIWDSDDFFSIRNYSQNIILTIPGQSESKIIVGAHYDTPNYPGASDNASGTALLLESAQRMLEQDNYHTIVYVFFGAEEVGLIGAMVYYDSLSEQDRENIVMMINADVLIDGDFFFYGAGYNDEMAHAFDVAGKEARENALSRKVSNIIGEVRHTHDIAIHTINESIIGAASDHRVFLHEGHTVVALWGFERRSYEEYELFSRYAFFHYEDYVIIARILHSPRDCFHYINENFPGKIDEAMRTFSLVLESLLLARFS